jgi:hypothetical protein
MESELDLESRGYIESESDPGFARCKFCMSKIYVGQNKTDLWRHEEQCKWR